MISKMNRILLMLFLSLCFTICSAGEYKDTLWTTDGDRIIITYDLDFKNDEVKVVFDENIRKKISSSNKRKYQKSADVDVVFFDRVGVYGDGMLFNITPEAFCVPDELEYSPSETGYFSLKDAPTLSFKIKNKAELSIPLYLAYYKDKGERELFAVCKDFKITLNSPKVGNKKNVVAGIDRYETETVTVTKEIEADAENEIALKVIESVNLIKELLAEQEKLPFGETLTYEISYLRTLQKEVRDRELLSMIKECLNSCDEKKIELEEKAEAERVSAEREENERIKEEKAREKAEQDSIRDAQEKKSAVEQEKREKRNLWMIIGGVILAALSFIGNQVFQHFRVLRNQRNMMEMQQSIASRAEYEAKRHAQNYARRKTNEVIYNARRGAQEALRNKNNQRGGNKSKKMSI